MEEESSSPFPVSSFISSHPSSVDPLVLPSLLVSRSTTPTCVVGVGERRRREEEERRGVSAIDSSTVHGRDRLKDAYV